MSIGKSIRIYLKEGSVSGVKLAEVVNLTIQAIACPRALISELNNSFENEINRPGIYFLIGDDKNHFGKHKVYIGESENVWDRLKQHIFSKDFWSELILFTSKDNNLTKSHVKYLEARLIDITIQASRYSIDNNNLSKLPSLPLPDRDSMEDFLENIKLLNGTLGHKFLEVLLTDNWNENTISERIENKDQSFLTIKNLSLELSVKNIHARAVQTEEGILVLRGSFASRHETKRIPPAYKEYRESLLSSGSLVEFGNELKFDKDCLFDSPSAAAGVIVGYSINGRTAWKNNKGETLKEIEEMLLSHQ